MSQFIGIHGDYTIGSHQPRLFLVSKHQYGLLKALKLDFRRRLWLNLSTSFILFVVCLHSGKKLSQFMGIVADYTKVANNQGSP
jgi:hypothetical protein